MQTKPRYLARKVRACALISMHLLACYSASAQTMKQPLPAPRGFHYLQKLTSDELALGDPGLFSNTAEGRAHLNQHYGALNAIGITRSWLGDADGAMAAFDLMRPTWGPLANLKSEDAELIKNGVAEEAIAAIVREAKNRQIVILNEAHHVSMHRAFAMQLARELRKLGFEYLACEAFSARGSSLLADGYVHAGDAYYAQDPVFAEFLRDASLSGWKLIPYEQVSADRNLSMIERMAQRETVQASNLLNRIFAKDPKAKVFIYVGYDHGVKTTNSIYHADWMAARLKRMTGIDPLSIDQTVMLNHTTPAAEYPAYRPAIGKFSAEMPFVLKTAAGYAVFGQEAGAFDMQVIYPPQQMLNGRPAWLVSLAGRRPKPVPPDWLPHSGRRLLYAYHQGDGPGAVPADLVLVEAGKPVPSLMLPPGEYEFAAED